MIWFQHGYSLLSEAHHTTYIPGDASPLGTETAGVGAQALISQRYVPRDEYDSSACKKGQISVKGALDVARPCCQKARHYKGSLSRRLLDLCKRPQELAERREGSMSLTSMDVDSAQHSCEA